MIVSKPLPAFMDKFERIAQEAFEENKEPVLALRYYYPDSILAAKDGWIDLCIVMTSDLAHNQFVHVEYDYKT